MTTLLPRPRHLASGGGTTLERILFEAAIVPHRSLSQGGQRRVLAAIAALLVVATLLCLRLGAWPVAGFAVAEMLIAVFFFRWHARHARSSELIVLTETELRITRTDAAGRRSERTLSPAWLQARLEERPGQAPLLLLTARGVAEEIGADLGEAERRDLAGALQSALHALRSPTFDNPILRES
jgi:uncharacterized membrane protein